jgi:hypothetical protein
MDKEFEKEKQGRDHPNYFFKLNLLGTLLESSEVVFMA